MNTKARIPGLPVIVAVLLIAAACAQPAAPSPTATTPPAATAPTRTAAPTRATAPAPTSAPAQTAAPTATPSPARTAPPTETAAPTRAATPAPTMVPAGGGTPTAGVIVVPGATSQVPPTDATPIPTPMGLGPAQGLPGSAQGLLATARADAAQRAGVTADEVVAVRIEAVEWRDGSLGCPQPGMMYPQVITPGYLFILEAGGNRYEYHADQGSRVFLCGRPQGSAMPGRGEGGRWPPFATSTPAAS